MIQNDQHRWSFDNLVTLRFRKAGGVLCGGARETHWPTCHNKVTPSKPKEFLKYPRFFRSSRYDIQKFIIFYDVTFLFKFFEILSRFVWLADVGRQNLKLFILRGEKLSQESTEREVISQKVWGFYANKISLFQPSFAIAKKLLTLRHPFNGQEFRNFLSIYFSTLSVWL